MSSAARFIFIVTILGFFMLVTPHVVMTEEQQNCPVKSVTGKVHFLHLKLASEETSANLEAEKTDEAAAKKFRVFCDNGQRIIDLDVNVGDWIAWTQSLDENPVKIHFTKDLPLFGVDNRKIRIHNGKWTWMRVQEFAAPEGSSGKIKHPYTVDPFKHDDPPPTIIVIPPDDEDDDG